MSGYVSVIMALNIRNSEAERLVGELAKLTGETKTEVVRKALLDRLQRVRQQQKGEGKLANELDEIARHCAALPIVDSRKPAAMLYDEHGLPL